jgi:hypothetical protein
MWGERPLQAQGDMRKKELASQGPQDPAVVGHRTWTVFSVYTREFMNFRIHHLTSVLKAHFGQNAKMSDNSY